MPESYGYAWRGQIDFDNGTNAKRVRAGCSRSLAVLGGPAFARGYGALAPAPKALGAGAGDETRTRDVLLGKEVLYH